MRKKVIVDQQYLNLFNEEFKETMFKSCRFGGTIGHCKFENCKFENCEFEDTVYNCSFYDCEWDNDCKFDDNIVYKETYIDGKRF